jgi:5-methylcytosine-specific restriction endonuclease McrA
MATSSIRKYMPPRKRAKVNTPQSVKPDSVFFTAGERGYTRTAADTLQMILDAHLGQQLRAQKLRRLKVFPATVAQLAGAKIMNDIDAWEWLLESYTASNPEWRFAGYDNAVTAMRRGFNRTRKQLDAQRDAALARAAALAAQQIPGAEFYQSLAWRELRYKVLMKSKGCCEACRRTARDHGVALHVDHIMPRSQFPDVALEETNLQVLCDDCNIGKGTGDTTDWRASSTG